MKMRRFKDFLQFDLPVFTVWILKQPFREVADFWKGVKYYWRQAGKPKNMTTVFVVVFAIGALTASKEVMVFGFVMSLIAWVVYHYQTKRYVHEWREKQYKS